MIVQADGTDWDPGEGAGTYKYEAGVWKRFGDADHVHTLVDITDAGALAALDEVALSDIADIATQRVIGRNTAGTGVPEQVSLTQLLDFIGSAARGDLLVRGASTWARLGIGTSGHVLKSDGTDPAWGLPGGWTVLDTQAMASQSECDFADISQNHKILLVIGTEIDTSLSTGSNFLQFADDNTFTGFYDTYIGGVAAVGTSFQGSGLSSGTSMNWIAGDTAGTAYGVALIFNYSSTTTHKVVITFGGRALASSVAALNIGVVRTTDAIQNLRVDGNGTLNSGTFMLVGLF
jgi:hypothetical protein